MSFPTQNSRHDWDELAERARLSAQRLPEGAAKTQAEQNAREIKQAASMKRWLSPNDSQSPQ